MKKKTGSGGSGAADSGLDNVNNTNHPHNGGSDQAGVYTGTNSK